MCYIHICIYILIYIYIYICIYKKILFKKKSRAFQRWQGEVCEWILREEREGGPDVIIF